MNIRFTSIDIENFRSIGKASIPLNNQGTVIVRGINEYEDKATSNGSGKSSIFEAIIYALFEETSSGEKDVANRVSNVGFNILLRFQIDGVDYTILRQQKNGKSSVILYKDNIDISARNKTDTNKLICQLLGISKSLFLDSIFLSQNANTNLASLTPTARKERLEILTNTDYVVNEFKDKLKEQQNIYEASCVDTQLKINQLAGSKNANIQQQTELQNKIVAIEQEIEQLKSLGDVQEIEKAIAYKETTEIGRIDELIDNLSLDINNIEHEIETLRESIESNLNNKNKLDKEKQDKLLEWNDIDGQIKNKQVNIEFAKKNKQRLDLEIGKIKLSDTCPTCGRKYENANEEHIQKTITKLNNDKIEYDKQIDECNIAIKPLMEIQMEIELNGRNIANEIIKVDAAIDEIKNQINEKESKRKELNYSKQMYLEHRVKCQKDIDDLRVRKEQLLKAQTNNINEYREMITNINEEIDRIDKQVVELEQYYSMNNDYVSVLKNSIQLVTKEFRTYLLQNSLQYINHMLIDYSQKLFSNEKDIIRIVEDDTKLNIMLGDATYESLSGGEKTRVNIALLLAQKSLAEVIGNISCNMIILDEILGYCDSQAEENVINLLTSELDTLESIYMVSHKEIPIGYDAQLIVVKDRNGISSIVSR